MLEDTTNNILVHTTIAMESMDSVEVSSTEVEVAAAHLGCASSSSGGGRGVEDDENDKAGTTTSTSRPQHFSNQPHNIVSAPLSGDSIPSSPTDQVLDLDNRLDCSDSNALVSRISQQQEQQQPSSSSSIPVQHSQSEVIEVSTPPRPIHRRLSMSSRTNSFRQSAAKLARPNFSRRPSMHETHDSEPLMRGEFLYYLYSFAMLGTAIRIFLARFFGGDCEHPGETTDFMSPLSNHICVTSSGQTIQHGGALFLDLPANMLGSFIMGLVSSLHPVGGRPGSHLPWLHKDHALQKHEGIHHAIKVGFCGSLTTFSSWNSQMVMMMEGTDTELGSQAVSALFGYVIGMACAAWSFSIGGRAHEWVYDWSNGIKDNSSPPSQPAKKIHGSGLDDCNDDDEEQPPTSWDSQESHMRFRNTAFSSNEESSSSVALALETDEDRRESQVVREAMRKKSITWCTILLHKVLPCLIVIAVLVAYGVTVNEDNAQFYREFVACTLLTPIGVHFRWKLAALNGRRIGSSRKLEWVPWGTFMGNVSASAISIVFAALYMKHHKAGTEAYPYIMALLVGMKTGVAGSLSTVSSFAKEVVNLTTIHPTHAKSYIYTAATIITSMFVGLIFYSPIIRYT